MDNRLKVIKLEQTCSACPSQWDAWTDKGEYLYIRFRWGNLSVSKGDYSKRIYSEQVGDGLDGCMDISSVEEHTSHIIDWSSYEYV